MPRAQRHHGAQMMSVICLHLGSVFLCVGFIRKCSLPEEFPSFEMDTSSSRFTVSQPNISNEGRAPFHPIVPAKDPELSLTGLVWSHAHPRTSHHNQEIECSVWPSLSHVPSFWAGGGISPIHSTQSEPKEGVTSAFVLSKQMPTVSPLPTPPGFAYGLVCGGG